MTIEVQRALDTPRKLLAPDREHIERLVGWHPPTTLLNDDQIAMLWEAHTAGGLVASAGVGIGKGLTALLLPTVMGSTKPIQFVKKGLLANLQREYAKWQHAYIIVPFQTMTYDSLSLQKNAETLLSTECDLIVLDEAHLLKGQTSARTNRIVDRVIAGGSRDGAETVKVCAVTGTLSTDNVTEYAHIAELCLREGSPVPYGDTEACAAWGRGLGAINKAKPSDYSHIRPLLTRYPQPHLPTHTEAGHAAMKAHLSTTAGFVLTTEVSCRASIVATRITLPKMPADIAALVDKVAMTQRAPDETPLTVLETDMVCRQLQYGYWYKKDWGDVPLLVQDEWRLAAGIWHKAVRDYLQGTKLPGIDSAGLILTAALAGKLGDYGQQIAQDYENVRHIAKYKLVAHWVWEGWYADQMRWLADRDVAGRRGNGHGLLWYTSRTAVGNRLVRDGVKVYAENAVMDYDTPHTCALQIRSMREGHNLQAWRHSRFAQAVANPGWMQQAMGRTHRQGQTADEVFFQFVSHTKALRSTWERAMVGARYIEETLGERQRLSIASWTDDDT